MSENDENRASNKLTRKTALVVLLYVSPLFLLFAVLGDPARGRAASICGSMVILGALLFRDLLRPQRFWTTVAILSLAQIPIVYFNPWGSGSYPGTALLPFALMDFAIIWGIFKLVVKLSSKTTET